MPYNANLGTQSFNEVAVVDYSHPPIITTMEPLADQGELAPGLMASEDGNGKVVPYDQYTEVFGTGDGAVTDFTGTLSNAPVMPGRVEVTDGSETFVDDEQGNLESDAGGTGTINYLTGEISVSFNSAPSTDADVQASYVNRIAGVVTLRCDTANEDAASVLEHGTVARNMLSRNGSEPTAGDIKSLRAAGIYPR